VELLDLEQAASDPAAQFQLREYLEEELGLIVMLTEQSIDLQCGLAPSE